MTPVQRPVVYDGGIAGFKVDDGSYPDIIGHLYTEFLKSCTEQKIVFNKRDQKMTLAFLEFARKFLDTNPPRSQRYVGRGLALELQNGTILTFSTQDATVVAHRDDSVAINHAKSQPGQHGISDMGSVPITTGRTRTENVQVNAPDQKPAARPGKPKRSGRGKN